jgi:hypothetical protein
MSRHKLHNRHLLGSAATSKASLLLFFSFNKVGGRVIFHVTLCFLRCCSVGGKVRPASGSRHAQVMHANQ